MDGLAARFKAGDEDAVRDVVQKYSGAVQTVARSMVQAPELVAEVVQQTFVKAWKASASFDDGRELAPWLYSIARRTAIDVIRRENKPTTNTAELPLDLAGNAISFERTWEIYEVRQALDALPAEERVVMRMSFLSGMTHEQIADELGIPIGTVKSRTGRAKKRLATALGHMSPSANQTPASNVEGVEPL